MAINHDTRPFPLTVNQVQLEKVNRFTYLGTQLCADGSSNADIQQRIQKAQTVFASLRKPFLNRREISIRTKVRIYMALVRTSHRWSTQWFAFAEQLAQDQITWSKKVSKIVNAGRDGNA